MLGVIHLVLYVVRHGETDYNVQGRYGGSRDIPLNEQGRKQALQLIETLKEIHFDAIVTSSLLRARQTAGIIRETFPVPLAVSDDFRERCLGVYEGLTKVEARALYPDQYARNCTRLVDDAPANGETIRQFDERVTKGLVKLTEQYLNKSVLLVTHGFVSRVINRYYRRLSYDEMHGFDLGNCEIAAYTQP